ncbi:MAG: hypothetical protein QW374_06770, partial [Candidatus Bathyarchaeia archaeon]
MNLRNILLSLTLLSLIAAISILAIVSVNSVPVYAQIDIDYITPMMAALDIGELKRYIDDLVGFGSRFTGYPGCYAAADYIEAKFREFGLQD